MAGRDSRIAGARQLAKLASARARYYLVERPIIIHRERADDEPVCDCGCDSPCAYGFVRREHLVVLFDATRGTRLKRTPSNAAKFDAYVAELEATGVLKRIWLPARLHEAQVAIFLDRKSRIRGAFGGNRSGKTQVLYECLVDEVIGDGGRGHKFLIVTPNLPFIFDIAIPKLIEGEVTNKRAPPLLPPELVAFCPPTPQHRKQYIEIIDGTRIWLKHASREGRNLKGINARSIFVDEGAEITHEINWTILAGRLLDTNGRMMVATTPVAGHWIKGQVFDRGHFYGEGYVPPERQDIALVELSCLQNPFLPPGSVRRHIESLGGEDDPRVKREVFGQWVTDGLMLWRHWEQRAMTFEGIVREPDYYGFVDITPKIVRQLFRDGRTDMIGAMDFNNYPMSLLICHVVCRRDDDQGDPRNWLLWVRDECVKRSSISEFPGYLKREAPRVRRLERDHFNGLCIVGDSNACYADTRVNQAGQGADADFLRREGFFVEPPAYSEHGNPKNPSIRDRINLLHELMATRRLLVHGSDCPKLLESINSQQAQNTGLPVKDSNTVSDRLSGPTDALGYLAYAIFGGPSVSPRGEAVW